MKCFIIDTLVGIFAIDDVGNILNYINFNNNDDEIIKFYQSLSKDFLKTEYKDFLKELAISGFNQFIFDNKVLENLTSQKLDYTTFYKNYAAEFKDFRFNLSENLKKIGIDKTREEILTRFKKIEEELIKEEVKKAGAQGDIIIIQIIEALDTIKKSISLFSSRLREWYGLHFPELTDKLIEDNIIIARMVSDLGNRNNFTIEELNKGFDIKEDRVKLLQDLASRSMGANIELEFVQGFANQIISLDNYREELEDYLERMMEKFAPNLNAIVGNLVGAKLIAKAGSLKKLAYMPASRIQLLGAEKALYRFLKTGEKRPKHGLIFQWNLIRGSKPHNRGKISRVISGKIGISVKVDYFGGEFIADVLSKELNEKIKEIEKKYPKPPKKSELKKPPRKRKNVKVIKNEIKKEKRVI